MGGRGWGISVEVLFGEEDDEGDREKEEEGAEGGEGGERGEETEVLVLESALDLWKEMKRRWDGRERGEGGEESMRGMGRRRKSVLAFVPEPLSHGGSGVRSEELKGGGVGGSSGDDDAVRHGLLLVELPDELGDGGSLLSNSNVDARKGLGLGLLVNNGVNSEGGLSGLAIADDELTLATADGDEGIDGLEAGKHGLRGGGMRRKEKVERIEAGRIGAAGCIGVRRMGAGRIGAGRIGTGRIGA